MSSIDTSDEQCALMCMLVSNPQGALRQDGDGWQRRVNDFMRALRDERNSQRELLAKVRFRLKAQTDVGLVSRFPDDEDPQHEFTELLVDLDDALPQSK